MQRCVSCPCQPKPYTQSSRILPPVSYRIEELARPKQIYTDKVCNMSIFRVETMMNQIIKRDFMSPRDLLRAESEAHIRQKNKESREKKLEKDRILKKMCEDTLEGLLRSMRPVMLSADTPTKNSELYRDIHADLLKLLKQNPDQKLQELPKDILSKLASKAASRVGKIAGRANRMTQLEVPYDCFEECKRGKFEIERCIKPRLSEEDEFFDANDTLRGSGAWGTDADGRAGGMAFDDSDYNFVSIRDSCDDVLRKSQLTMDGVDCQEIFGHIDEYKTRVTERKTEQEAKKKAKAEKLKKRAAKKKAAKKAQALPECVPGAGGPKKWEVAFGRQD